MKPAVAVWESGNGIGHSNEVTLKFGTHYRCPRAVDTAVDMASVYRA